MPLPNLSANNNSFIAAQNDYNTGQESYRDQIREKMQSTPRRSYENTRSIDLSIKSDNLFRSTSRLNYNRENVLPENLFGNPNDTNNNEWTPRPKSSRNRQIIFYNNDNTNNTNNNSNNNNTTTTNNNKNSNTNRQDNETNYRVETRATSRMQKYNDKEIIFDDNNNNLKSSRGEKPQILLDTVQISRNEPLITPRRSISSALKPNRLSNKSLQLNQDNLKDLNEDNRSPSRIRRSSQSRNNNRSENFGEDTDSDSRSFNNTEITSSKVNFRDDEPPVPAPRKNVFSTKLMPTDNNDLRIKRANTKILSGRSSYMPSPRVEQAESTYMPSARINRPESSINSARINQPPPSSSQVENNYFQSSNDYQVSKKKDFSRPESRHQMHKSLVKPLNTNSEQISSSDSFDNISSKNVNNSSNLRKSSNWA